jgi:RNA ligase
MLVDRTNMFYCQQHENLYLFSYHFVDPKVFEQYSIAKELRGIVFDDKGNVVLRPFPKFFNYGEPACNVKPDDIAVSNEKYDGSLVSAGWHNDSLIVASKGSLKSWVVEKAKPFISQHENYLNLIQDFKGKTVMFELLDPHNPIVIHYPKLQLILIGIRDNKTGKLTHPRELVEIGKQYNIPTAQIVYDNITVKELQRKIKPLQNTEGVVAYTDTDICKIKTAWYFNVHKIATNLNEKKVLKAFINNEIDDIYGFLPENTKRFVDKIIQKATEIINAKIKKVEQFFKEHNFKTRKELALTLQSQNINRKEYWIYFKVYEGMPIKEAVYRYFKNEWSK